MTEKIIKTLVVFAMTMIYSGGLERFTELQLFKDLCNSVEYYRAYRAKELGLLLEISNLPQISPESARVLQYIHTKAMEGVTGTEMLRDPEMPELENQEIKELIVSRLQRNFEPNSLLKALEWIDCLPLQAEFEPNTPDFVVQVLRMLANKTKFFKNRAFDKPLRKIDFEPSGFDEEVVTALKGKYDLVIFIIENMFDITQENPPGIDREMIRRVRRVGERLLQTHSEQALWVQMFQEISRMCEAQYPPIAQKANIMGHAISEYFAERQQA